MNTQLADSDKPETARLVGHEEESGISLFVVDDGNGRFDNKILELRSTSSDGDEVALTMLGAEFRKLVAFARKEGYNEPRREGL